MRDRLKEILGELRGLVEQAQDALDERPIRRRLLAALRAKIDEADEAEDADEDEGEQQP